MEKEIIRTSATPSPGGWYSHACKVNGTIYLAGITANDPATKQLVAPGDIVGQTRQIVKNMTAILEAAGSDLEHVVKTQVFVKDINDFKKFDETYKTFFPSAPPARSTVQVGNFLGDVVIEVEAIAVEK